jgi:hypothetical protein
MGLFDDKQYDEMDWLVKAIEPVISDKNTALSEVPDEIPLSLEKLFTLFQNHYGTTLDYETIITAMIAPYIKTDIPCKKIVKYFDIVQTGSKAVTFDFKNGTAFGDPFIIRKTVSIIEEKDLLKDMGRAGLDGILLLNHRDTTTERCNEIAELLGCSAALSKRSTSGKLDEIRKSLATHINKNKWNIKNVELADRVCHWIVLYLKNGSLPALTNFCKFKVMTHSGDAIYSIEEEPI